VRRHITADSAMRSPAPRRRPVFFGLLAAAALIAAVRMVAVPGIRLASVAQATPVVVHVGPAQVPAGGWTSLTFTVTAGAHAVNDASVAITVPAGWPRPSRSVLSPGHVTASAGVLTFHGNVVSARGVELSPGSRFTILYGAGRAGPTEPTVVGRYTFSVAVAAAPSAALAPVSRSVSVGVQGPHFGCTTALDPVGIGMPLILANGIAHANLYNAQASSGVIRQCYGHSGVTTSIDLRTVSPVGPGPVGYPEVAYGYHLYDRPFCPTCHAQPFPLRVSALRRYGRASRVAAAYSLGTPSPTSLPRDFIYDLWLERHPSPDAAPRPGDIELLVFLYYHEPNATCQPSPPSSAFSTSVSFDGRRVVSRWSVCRLAGGTRATPVAFFLEQPTPSPTGDVSLPLNALIDEAGQFVGKDLRRYFLMGIELGGEFDQCAPPAGCVAAGARWSWRISRLALEGTPTSIPIVFPVGR
jgi:Glycosyl hydrolase family 12